MTSRDSHLYLAHIRDAIDEEIVWNVVEKELPRLREAIERLMAQATPCD
jgi:uncharacterized protein with HEPN domain